MGMNSNAPWVEGPYKLIPIPASSGGVKVHYAVEMANEMAFVHNCFIRGFNSILLQGPHIPSYGQPDYRPQDVKDFLLFTDFLIRVLHHHHKVEETVGFPEIEKEIGEPGFLSVATEQHAQFHDGLEIIWEMAKTMQNDPSKWTWDAMKQCLDSFMPVMYTHLVEEIDLFLKLGQFNEKALKRAWKALEEEAKKIGFAGLYDTIPTIFGCHDASFQSGGKFPPVPKVFRYLVKHWTSKRNRGVWRFCPCDEWSRPKPLLFSEGK
ncbi:uncharacterized protein PV09_03738 [Verruconis gallopava]|uniref:Hemerythrin-like domain-containing protein n=1 Tax=Verruconis gallopava TaxID=253628 RepID=A0A0D2AFD5_9PEZI|nr:uncharacterized protein PV09_03738 [Verruconis gallopava]KIW05190.1 hypothetical protein PV09_03738 [Verruconis gallopava]